MGRSSRRRCVSCSWPAALFALAGLACGGGAGVRAAASEDAAVPDGGSLVDASRSPSEGGPPQEGPLILQPAPADFFFLVDSSGSWSRRLDRWEGLRSALSGFLAEHGTKHELAATSFPRLIGSQAWCDARAYESPILDWPAAPSAIDAFVSGLSMEGESPLGPAIAGAIASARFHRSGAPARSTSVVLLTDATPLDDETCDTSDWAKVAATASEGFALGQGSSIHIDVISVMGRAVSPDHFGLVGEIAIRGGGVPAFVNGSTGDIARSARNALEMLRDRRTTCTLIAPAETRPEELTLTFSDGTVETAHRVADAAACEGRAFYLDDTAHAATATLCSGEAGIGGYCEMTFVRAGQVGRPTVTVSRGTPQPMTVP